LLFHFFHFRIDLVIVAIRKELLIQLLLLVHCYVICKSFWELILSHGLRINHELLMQLHLLYLILNVPYFIKSKHFISNLVVLGLFSAGQVANVAICRI
jgi:hypothetical protein